MHPDTAPTTRPVNLTEESVLDQKAEQWIAENGYPKIALVEQAIRVSNFAGDPLCDNPFRHALIRVMARQNISRYGYADPNKEN